MTGSTTTRTETLSGSEDYFLKVLTPNRDAFFGAPSTFSSALNLATALFHFHEWLFDEYKAELESHYGKAFARKSEFWQVVQATNTNFGYIRDVTNASKHVRIGGSGHRTSTGMSHIANTHITFSSYGDGGFGQSRYGGGPSVVFDDGGSQISFDNCANELFEYWKSLLQHLTGRLYT